MLLLFRLSFGLQMIVDVLGCPSEEDMCFIQDKAARAVVLQQARQAGARRGTGGVRPLSVYFPTTTSPLALDLLSKMVSVLLFLFFCRKN